MSPRFHCKAQPSENSRAHSSESICITARSCRCSKRSDCVIPSLLRRFVSPSVFSSSVRIENYTRKVKKSIEFVKVKSSWARFESQNNKWLTDLITNVAWQNLGWWTRSWCPLLGRRCATESSWPAPWCRDTNTQSDEKPSKNTCKTVMKMGFADWLHDNGPLEPIRVGWWVDSTLAMCSLRGWPSTLVMEARQLPLKMTRISRKRMQMKTTMLILGKRAEPLRHRVRYQTMHQYHQQTTEYEHGGLMMVLDWRVMFQWPTDDDSTARKKMTSQNHLVAMTKNHRFCDETHHVMMMTKTRLTYLAWRQQFGMKQPTAASKLEYESKKNMNEL